MIGQGGEAMQVIYMEVEGIKLTYQLTKDAVKLAKQLVLFLLGTIRDTPYKKQMGQTNIKNFKARAGDQATIPATVDEETYRRLKPMLKQYGILYHEFKPLRSGKKGAVELIFMEKDLALVQELLSRLKKEKIREDVKNGMEEEASEHSFDENNRTETMDEFAENVGTTTSAEAFDADMKERFGEDYEKNIIDFEKYAQEHQEGKNPKGQAAGMDREKVDNLAEIIQIKDHATRLKTGDSVQIPFVYDADNGKSQITEETETHVKIAGKGLNAEGNPGKWGSIWVPKDAIYPSLDKEPEAGGKRTVYLPKDADIVVEDMTGKEQPRKMKAADVDKLKSWNAGVFESGGKKYQAVKDERMQNNLDITISKELVHGETEEAYKTRVPGTWGENVRYLWIDKADCMDVYSGQSLLTSLNPEKNYKLYAGDGTPTEMMRGKDLYHNHYDAVNAGVRRNAQATAAVGGRRRM